MVRLAVLFLVMTAACTEVSKEDGGEPEALFDAGPDSTADAGLPTCTAPEDVDGGSPCSSDEDCTSDEYCFYEVMACTGTTDHVERTAPGRCITPCCGTRNCEGSRCAVKSDCGPQELCSAANVCEWGGECTAIIECGEADGGCPQQLVPGRNCPSCVCETCP